MRLLPLDTPARIALAAGWLSNPDNARWLDFGSGVQHLDAATLRVMTQRDIHCLRLYTADDGATPAGIIGLSNIDRSFKTATTWVVLGVKQFGGCTVRAGAQLLRLAFVDLGLEAVNCWTVEINRAGQNLIERLGFRFIGRQRQCHVIDGRRYDRLFYDLLAAEYRGLA